MADHVHDPGAAADREVRLGALLEALEDVVREARPMPLSSSVLVQRAELLDLVAQARAAVPAELGQADLVLAGADDVLVEAQRSAERVLAAARERAAELVGREEVVVAARARAAEVLAEAERTAAALRHDADDYCDRRLAELEIDLGKVLTQVRAGRDSLAARLEARGGDEG